MATAEAVRALRRPSLPAGAVARSAGVAVLIVLLWWVLSIAYAPRGGIFPSPWSVITQFGVDGWAFYGPSLGATLAEAAQGFVWGNLIALLLGAFTALLPAIRPFVSQLALFAYSVPIIAIGPILVTAFPGRTPMIVMSAAAVVFLTLSAVIDGLDMADRGAIDIVDSLGGTGRDRLWFVRWWYALPSILSGLKLAVPGALLGAIFGEFLGRVDSGLGVVLVRAQKELEVERAWGIIVVMIAVSAVGYLLVALAGRRLTRWSGDVVVGPGRPDGRIWVNVFGVLGSGALLLAIWWVGLSVAGINPAIGKTPMDVLNYLFLAEGSAATRAQIAGQLGITLVDTAGGFAVGIGLAVIASALTVRSRWLADMLVPFAILLRATPLIAIAPVLFIAIGRGYAAVTVLVAIVVFFPAFLILLEGMRVTPVPLTDLVDVLGGGGFARTWFVTLPASIPYLFSALRVTLPNAIMGALIAEWLATGSGIGAALISDIARFRFDALWAGVFVATAVSVLLYTIVDLAEVAYRRAKHLG